MATKANAGAANLIPGGNRKGKIGVRKKITKSLLEQLHDIVMENIPDLKKNLLMMAQTDPEKHAKTIEGIIKIIAPRQIQLEATTSTTTTEIKTVQIEFVSPEFERLEETKSPTLPLTQDASGAYALIPTFEDDDD